MTQLDLSNDWLLRWEPLWWGLEKHMVVLERTEGWLAVDLPCDVHEPLITHGIIPEPLEGTNYEQCCWVEEKSWWFQKVFNVEEPIFQGDRIELTLEALDAEADIFLNGVHLGRQRSVFYPFSREVKSILKKGENRLLVRLTSGLEHVSVEMLSIIEPNVNTEASEGRGNRGDKRRAFVRKPQFVYGWDWGPRVATCGIMKGVYLESHQQVALRRVHAWTLNIDPVPRVAFDFEIGNLRDVTSMDGLATVMVEDDSGEVLTLQQDIFLQTGLNFIHFEADFPTAKLWWPNGMGIPHLYTVKVIVEAAGVRVEGKPFRFGIRTVKMDLSPLGNGERRFAFEINGVKTYCKGANWIPADSIYARVTPEKYERLLSEAKDAQFNMLRVWGGGWYEPDYFYEKCDEYGLMLWHDFMYACGLYPDHLEWFLREAEREIDYETKYLSNHPSIVLWCGNNENHTAFNTWWPGEKTPVFFGGAEVYHRIAPELVRKNCPEIFYWVSSPFGGEFPHDQRVGDVHPWHEFFMNPEMETRITPEKYDELDPKFVSEFGFVGAPLKSTILRYHNGLPVEPGSKIWREHTNTFEKDTVPAVIRKHYADPGSLDLDRYLLYSGLCQGMMLGYALEGWRANENCYGGLFWMYNDCWGEIGWTIIDYYLTRKISYYHIKRAYAPVKLIIRQKNGRIRVTGINETEATVVFPVEYGFLSFDGGTREFQSASVQLAPYSREVVSEIPVGSHDPKTGCYFIRPLQENSGILPALLHYGPVRDLQLPIPRLTLSEPEWKNGQWTFSVQTDFFAHAVHFPCKGITRFSDEYFDLLPGETRVIVVEDEVETLPEIRVDSVLAP